MKQVMLAFECPADFTFTHYAIVAVSDDGRTYSSHLSPMHPWFALEFVKGLVACVLPPVQQKMANDERRIVSPPPGMLN
jgi:hypothetical protein